MILIADGYTKETEFCREVEEKEEVKEKEDEEDEEEEEEEEEEKKSYSIGKNKVFDKDQRHWTR